MNYKIIKFETEDGDIIYVEAEEIQFGRDDYNEGLAVAGSKDEEGSSIKNATSKFEKALEPIRKISNHLVQNIKDIDITPDEVSVELGLKFNAEAGIIISKASTEANIKINLTWKRAL